MRSCFAPFCLLAVLFGCNGSDDTETTDAGRLSQPTEEDLGPVETETDASKDGEGAPCSRCALGQFLICGLVDGEPYEDEQWITGDGGDVSLRSRSGAKVVTVAMAPELESTQLNGLLELELNGEFVKVSSFDAAGLPVSLKECADSAPASSLVDMGSFFLVEMHDLIEIVPPVDPDAPCETPSKLYTDFSVCVGHAVPTQYE